MVTKRRIYLIVLVIGIAWYFHDPRPTVISLRIGQPFAEVIQGSTYPIKESGGVEFNNTEGFGWTDVTKPSVIIRFNDPKHGFTLPPTTFVGITYMDRKVQTIATSPMLKKLPFKEAVEELAVLQAEFQAKGWVVDEDTHTHWFDLSPSGRECLHTYMLSHDGGWSQEVQLIVPKKYEMVFRIKCAADCDSTWGLDRYLIDIGIGPNYPN